MSIVKSSPESIEIIRKKAQESRTQEDITELYLALRIAADLEPDNYENWREVSFFNANYGRVDEAANALRIAKALAPGNLDLKVDEAQLMTISNDST